MMSDLLERIQSDFKAAMKERRMMELSTLRMLKAEIQTFRASGDISCEVTDDDVLSLVQRLVKQRKDAARQYVAGGAEDRAKQELDEADFLTQYLPAQLPDEELKELVVTVIEEVGASSPRDMGRVMGKLMPAVQGRADGGRVRQLVQEQLKS